MYANTGCSRLEVTPIPCEVIGMKDLSVEKPAESCDKQSPQVEINNRAILGYCTLVACAALVIGFEIGTAEALINSRGFESRFHHLEGGMLGFVMSSFNIGLVIGCFCGFSLGKIRFDHMIKIGYGIYFIGVCTFWGCLMGSFGLFITYRMLLGISGGIFILVCPIYIAKLTLDPAKRGPNLSLVQFFLCIGILVGSGLSLLIDEFVLQLILNLVVVIIGVLSICFLPCTIDQETSPDKIRRFYRTDYGMDPEEIVRSIGCGAAAKFRWKKLALCMLLMVFQQFTGINYFFYYAKEVMPPGFPIVLLSAVNLFGSIVSYYAVGYFNRLSLLRSGSLIIVGLLVAYWLSKSYIVIYFVVLVFGTTWGPVAGILVNELASLQLSILTVSILVNFGMNTLIVNITPVIHTTVLLGIFATMTLLLEVFLIIVPETKPLSLSEIEQLFSV